MGGMTEFHHKESPPGEARFCRRAQDPAAKTNNIRNVSKVTEKPA
jgi:hypothetical protein